MRQGHWQDLDLKHRKEASEGKVIHVQRQTVSGVQGRMLKPCMNRSQKLGKHCQHHTDQGVSSNIPRLIENSHPDVTHSRGHDNVSVAFLTKKKKG